MSSKRRYLPRKKLKRGKNGRYLCRYCSTEVTPPRRTFCSDECVHEYKLRRNNGYLRYNLFKRDKGICAMCGVDTVALRNKGKKMKLKEFKAYAKSLGFSYKRKTFWEAHHITAVVEGGGLCGLEGFQTLCIACHRIETNKLLKRIRNQP